MKRFSRLIMFGLTSILLFSADAFAAQRVSARSFGLGVILGEPTGFSAQSVLDSEHKLNLSLAYSFNSWVQVTGDYIFMKPQWVTSLTKQNSPVSAYWGVGVLLGLLTDNKNTHGDFGVALRVPFGLEGMLAKEPFGFFVELVPGMRFAPATDLIFQGGIGARYYF